MEAFSPLLVIGAGNLPVPGEFPTQRPVTRNFDVFFRQGAKQTTFLNWFYQFAILPLLNECYEFAHTRDIRNMTQMPQEPSLSVCPKRHISVCLLFCLLFSRCLSPSVCHFHKFMSCIMQFNVVSQYSLGCFPHWSQVKHASDRFHCW